MAKERPKLYAILAFLSAIGLINTDLLNMDLDRKMLEMKI